MKEKERNIINICKHQKLTIIMSFLMLICCYQTSMAGKKDLSMSLRDSLIDFSKNYLGCKYKYGSKGPKTFDCSGFSGFVFNKFGMTLNSSSSSQYLQGEKVKLDDAKKGDLIFFNGRQAGGSNVGHVGIISDVNETGDTVWFIHASVQKGVLIDVYPGLDYYNRRYVGCKRVIAENWVSEREIEKAEKELEELQKEEELKEKEKSEKEVEKKEAKEPQRVDEKETPDCEQESVTQKEEVKKENSEKQEKKQKKNKSKKEKAKKGKKQEKAESESSEESGDRSQIVHIVCKGDTLYRLSLNYGCTVEEIKKWNKLKTDAIKIGDELVIRKK